MSSKSNTNGRAYEYTYLITLFEEISKFRGVRIEKNSSYDAARCAWVTLSEHEQRMFKLSALSTVRSLFDLEPLLLEEDFEELELKIQPDKNGEVGDVRDILIIKERMQWEIGLSVKHNHFAVKHSRLSATLDFGKKWYGIGCSDEYWNKIAPIFDFLVVAKNEGKMWHDLPSKEDEIYKPLLDALKNEIEYQSKKPDNGIGKALVEYLLGEFDFYKIISVDHLKTTKIQSFNLRGTLNKKGIKLKRQIDVPKVNLPTRVVSVEFKPNSKNTLEVYLDGGWQFSFRIHNASSKVEASLKFDIQLVGIPITVVSVDCKWRV